MKSVMVLTTSGGQVFKKNIPWNDCICTCRTHTCNLRLLKNESYEITKVHSQGQFHVFTLQEPLEFERAVRSIIFKTLGQVGSVKENYVPAE